MNISSNINFIVTQSYHIELSPVKKQVAKVTLLISLVAAACFICYKAYQFFTKPDPVPDSMIGDNDYPIMPTIEAEFNQNKEAFKFKIEDGTGGFKDISKESVFKFEDCPKIVKKTRGSYLEYDLGMGNAICYFHTQNGEMGRLDTPSDLYDTHKETLYNSIKKTCCQITTSKSISKMHSTYDRINGHLTNNAVPD